MLIRTVRVYVEPDPMSDGCTRLEARVCCRGREWTTARVVPTNHFVAMFDQVFDMVREQLRTAIADDLRPRGGGEASGADDPASHD